jgi:hypothetical protein
MDFPEHHKRMVADLEALATQIIETGMCLRTINHQYRERPVTESNFIGSHIRRMFKELKKTPIMGQGGHRYDTYNWVDGKRVPAGTAFSAELVFPRRVKLQPLLASIRLLDMQPAPYSHYGERSLLDLGGARPTPYGVTGSCIVVYERASVIEVTWRGLEAEKFYKNWRELVLTSPECRKALGLPSR